MNRLKSHAVLLGFTLTFIAGVFLMKSIQSNLRHSAIRLGIDLYPRWIGSQAVLEHQSPYAMETKRRIWNTIYGSPDQPLGNPFGFYYPPAVVSLIIPFILAGFALDSAAVVWCAFLWALWFAALFIWMAQVPPGKPALKPLTVLLLVTGILYRPAFSNYILGQFSLFSLTMLIGAWISHRTEKRVLVGVFASLSLIKPSLTMIPVALVLILFSRNIRAFLSFIVTSTLLYLPPTLILGWWIPDFLQAVSRYALENQVSWSAADITTIPGLAWLASSGLLLALGLSTKDESLVLASSLAVGAVFVPHTADYDLVGFALLIVWCGDRCLFAGERRGLTELAFFALVLFPWLSLFGFTLSGRSVEAWYRFVWLAYPPILLLSALSIFLFKNGARRPSPRLRGNWLGV